MSSFETLRLKLLELSESNCDHVINLYQSKEAVEFLQGIDAAQDIKLSIQCAKIYGGIGAYLIFEKSSEKFVGIAGIQKQEPMKDGSFAMPQHDVEFLILLDHQFKGLGYASEFCAAFFAKVFAAFPDLEIPARVNKNNAACLKLLKKFGFVEEGEVGYHCYSQGFVMLKNRAEVFFDGRNK